MTVDLKQAICGLLLYTVSTAAFCHPPLQLFIDLTPPNGTLRPPPGTFSGPVIIKSPITLDGRNQVIIDGNGDGTVVHINTDDVTVKNLHITNSGNSHDRADSAILITADGATVENNTIDNVLFGIHLQQADDNSIIGNRISSKQADSSLRGESIRLWYSTGNLIQNNTISAARDFLLTNSADNKIIGNQIEKSRIGMELIFSPDNELSGNIISNSDTGLVLIYSDEVKIHNNEIKHLRKISSSALAVKGSSLVSIENNTILHCRTGLTANTPTHPENIIYLRGNNFLYNDIAMYFYGDKGGHVISDNVFSHNIMEVAVSAPMSARGNKWSHNIWQTYEGFDRNQDSIGDTPYEVYLYSDRLWMDRPMIQFFRSSPALEMIDFIERLAPISEPQLILSDPTPRLN